MGISLGKQLTDCSPEARFFLEQREQSIGKDGLASFVDHGQPVGVPVVGQSSVGTLGNCARCQFVERAGCSRVGHAVAETPIRLAVQGDDRAPQPLEKADGVACPDCTGPR